MTETTVADETSTSGTSWVGKLVDEPERFTIELDVTPRPGAPTEADRHVVGVGFADFYRTEFDAAVRVARFLTGDWDSARDITQDAFCGLHRHWSRVKVPTAYLRRSLVNGAAGLHRRRSRDRQRPVPRAEVGELEAHELTDALAALPDRQRAAVVLRFHSDLADAAIADALDVKVGTVASLIHRALATLRIILADPESTRTRPDTTPESERS